MRFLGSHSTQANGKRIKKKARTAVVVSGLGDGAAAETWAGSGA